MKHSSVKILVTIMFLVWASPVLINNTNQYYSNYHSDSVAILLHEIGGNLEMLFELFVSITNRVLTGAQTYNLLLSIIFILNFYGSFLLLKSLKLKPFAKILGDLLISFSPIFVKYYFEWPYLANVSFTTLYFLNLLKFAELHKKRYAIFSGIFFALNFFNHPYQGIMLSLISVILLIYLFFREINKSLIESIKHIGSLGLVIIIFTLPVLRLWQLTSIKTEGTFNVYEATRSPSDRWAFSARPWHYLIPDIEHPILGNIAVKAHYWIWNQKPYYLTEPFFPKEHTLFLGYTLMTLSAYAIWKTYQNDLQKVASSLTQLFLQLIRSIQRIKPTQPSNKLAKFNKSTDLPKTILNSENNEILKTRDRRFAITFFLIIAVSAFIFSMPPYIGINNFKIYFPSYFIYEILPQFRAYARFGVFVFISNTIIAMIGLSHLAKTICNGKYKNWKHSPNIIITLISILAIFEFINFPPFHSISTLPTSPYVWMLEQKGPFSYMEIPTRTDYTDRLYTNGSNIKILNPYLTTPKEVAVIEDIIWQRENPDLPKEQIEKNKLFCERFKELNGKYIFYHRKEINKQKVVEEFKKTGIVTPRLKVAMAESWGYPIWGNHVPKSDEDLKKDWIRANMQQILISDVKLSFVKEFTNEEIIASRPNKNFSADKFDAVTVFELNQNYCNEITKSSQ